MINSKIFGYTLRHLIGKGGMAEVYYAENKLGRPAAIKILHGSLTSQPEVRERFENEARIMVSLDHPNIRKVYDVGEADGRPAIIMEYLEGFTLSEALVNHTLTAGQLPDLFDQAIEGLQYAHKKGVIHRDIKPSNLFLTTTGQLKILDFGIAKLEASSSHTITGQTLGTVLYMSPEQVQDPKRVDYRSDIYSLGVTFYHLVTGKTPYDVSTDSTFKIQTKIVQEDLDLNKLSNDWQARLAPCLRKIASTRTLPHTKLGSSGAASQQDRKPKSISSTDPSFTSWSTQTPSPEIPSYADAATEIDPIPYLPDNKTKVNSKFAKRSDKSMVIIGSCLILFVVAIIYFGFFFENESDQYQNKNQSFSSSSNDEYTKSEVNPVQFDYIKVENLNFYKILEKKKILIAFDAFNKMQIYNYGDKSPFFTKEYDKLQGFFYSYNQDILYLRFSDKIIVFDLETKAERIINSPKIEGRIRLISNEGKYIFSSSSNDIYCYDATNFNLVKTFHSNTQDVDYVVFDSNNEKLYSVGYNGIIRRWDFRSGKELDNPIRINQIIEGLIIDNQNKYLFAVDLYGTYFVIDIDHWKIIKKQRTIESKYTLYERFPIIDQNGFAFGHIRTEENPYIDSIYGIDIFNWKVISKVRIKTDFPNSTQPDIKNSLIFYMGRENDEIIHIVNMELVQ